MTPTTLVEPELEEAIEEREERKDAEHLLPRNGNGDAQGMLSVTPRHTTLGVVESAARGAANEYFL